jgi:NAD(P)H-hydrate epimerase
MEEVLSLEKIISMEKKVIEVIGIPSIVLMENAAQEIFSNILHKGESFIIFCGKGNNGGDGLALARKLILANKNVKVVILGDSKNTTKEFQLNYDILRKINANIEIFKGEIDNSFICQLVDADVVIDGIFGVGLNKEIKGLYFNAIETINKYAKFIVSIDIPSGLDVNTGTTKNICVKANETYTIEVYKKGFLKYEASKYLGDVKIIKIGMPKETISDYSDRVRFISDQEYRALIPIREPWGHKGDFGRVLILAGSKGFTGAAYITTEAAVRTGAGLVTLVIEDELRSILEGRLIEAMTVGYSEIHRIDKLIEQADVIACGPGLGSGKINIEMLNKFITSSKCPIILDADALNIISKDRKLLSFVKGRAIVTPHPGEMARLIDKSITYVEENRIDVCINYSKENDVVTLLKGYNTLISDGQDVIINKTGSSKMASGGMGDCLTGIITSLIGQKLELYKGAILGAYLHGYAGDALGENKHSVNARDIIERIPEIINEIVE